MKKFLALLAVTALAAFGLAACGGDDDDDGEDTAAVTTQAETATGGGAGGGGGSMVDISSPSGSELAFDQSEVTAQAGPVTINYDNPQSTSHDVVIEDSSGAELGGTELISQSTTSATVELQPGTYTFFCDVPGHREGGMEGTLTVE